MKQGISGVLVSDGTRVVATDQHGVYCLETTDPRPIIFISLPDGHACKDFYRHLPPGLDEAVVDFALEPRQVPDRFFFIQASDSHLETQPGTVAALAAEVNGLARQPAFVVMTGDLLDTAYAAREIGVLNQMYRLYIEESSTFRVPLYNAIGEHDMPIELPGEPPESGRGAFRKFLGPTYYSLNYGGCHFVVLDTLPPDDGASDGDDAQASWLRADLAHQDPQRPVCILTHKGPGNWAQFDRLSRAWRDRNLKAIFYGDIHGNSENEMEGVAWFGAGALCGRVTYFQSEEEESPAGYRLAWVDGGDFQSYPAALGNPHHIHVEQPKRRTLITSDFEVRACVIDLAGEIEEVSCQLGGGEPVALRLERHPLWGRGLGHVSVSGVSAGVQELVFVARGRAGAWPRSLPVVLDDRSRCATKADGRLLLSVGRVEAVHTVWFNGEPVGHLRPTEKPGEVRPTLVWREEYMDREWWDASFDVPARLLRRVNRVTVSGQDEDGRWHELECLNPSLEVEGRTYADKTLRWDYPYPFGQGILCVHQTFEAYLVIP